MSKGEPRTPPKGTSWPDRFQKRHRAYAQPPVPHHHPTSLCAVSGGLRAACFLLVSLLGWLSGLALSQLGRLFLSWLSAPSVSSGWSGWVLTLVHVPLLCCRPRVWGVEPYPGPGGHSRGEPPPWYRSPLGSKLPYTQPWTPPVLVCVVWLDNSEPPLLDAHYLVQHMAMYPRSLGYMDM